MICKTKTRIIADMQHTDRVRRSEEWTCEMLVGEAEWPLDHVVRSRRSKFILTLRSDMACCPTCSLRRNPHLAHFYPVADWEGYRVAVAGHRWCIYVHGTRNPLVRHCGCTYEWSMRTYACRFGPHWCASKAGESRERCPPRHEIVMVLLF